MLTRFRRSGSFAIVARWSSVIGTRCCVEHGRDQQHVRALLSRLELEPAMRLVLQHTRRERPEALAELDLEVHRRLHLRRPRIAEDAARAERARPELHPALEPADDLLRFQQIGDARRRVGVARRRDGTSRRRGRGTRRSRSDENAGPRKLPCWRSIEPVCPRLVEQLVPDEQRRAQRAAGVAGRRLNPDVVERPLAQQPAVGHAVERHAAGQHQTRHARLAEQLPADREHRVFGHRLDARRQVHVPLLDVRFGMPRRAAEQLVERAGSSSSGPGSS